MEFCGFDQALCAENKASDTAASSGWSTATEIAKATATNAIGWRAQGSEATAASAKAATNAIHQLKWANLTGAGLPRLGADQTKEKTTMITNQRIIAALTVAVFVAFGLLLGLAINHAQTPRNWHDHMWQSHHNTYIVRPKPTADPRITL